ncbi:MAG TPA: sugar phosphate isomerase/epimerase family protein [Chloroflexota bacterium]|nr:sugar phosphate isomerase/epimerase family protein [Chloroflexota bacterium]
MNIAFSTLASPDYSPVQIASAAREYGYDGVELHVLERTAISHTVLEQRLPELKRAFSDVPICSITAGGRFATPDPAARHEMERSVARCLELALELGCTRIKTFGGSMPPALPAGGEDAVFDYMGEHLTRLAHRAAQLGVRLMVETHDDFGRTRYLEALLDRVPSPAFGALWDVMHPFRFGDSPEVVDAALGARVFHVQVKDCVRIAPGTDTKSWRCVLLGHGELAADVQQAIRLLARRGYQDWISLDWPKGVYPDIEGPEVALPQAAPVLRKYIQAARSAAAAPG